MLSNVSMDTIRKVLGTSTASSVETEQPPTPPRAKTAKTAAPAAKNAKPAPRRPAAKAATAPPKTPARGSSKPPLAPADKKTPRKGRGAVSFADDKPKRAASKLSEEERAAKSMQGRVLRPLPVPATCTEDEAAIVAHINEYASAGAGVSIPRSTCRLIVSDILEALGKEGMSMKATAIGLLQCEAEKYVTDLFQRVSQHPEYVATRPLRPAAMQFEVSENTEAQKLQLRYDEVCEDCDITADLLQDEIREAKKQLKAGPATPRKKRANSVPSTPKPSKKARPSKEPPTPTARDDDDDGCEDDTLANDVEGELDSEETEQASTA